MQINKKKLRILWEQRRATYKHRKIKDIYSMAIATTILIALSIFNSGLNKPFLWIYILAYLLYLAGVLAVVNKINFLQIKKKGSEFSVAFLYSALDIAALILIFISLWLKGSSIFEGTTQSALAMSMIRWTLLVESFISLFLFPVILREKMRVPSNRGLRQTTMRVLALISTGVLIYVLMITFGNFSGLTLLILFLAFLLVFVLIPSLIWNILEILLLASSDWLKFEII